jgi:hypothetical protein
MEGMLDRLVALRNALDEASGMQRFDDPHGLVPLQGAQEALLEAQRFFEARR